MQSIPHVGMQNQAEANSCVIRRACYSIQPVLIYLQRLLNMNLSIQHDCMQMT